MKEFRKFLLILIRSVFREEKKRKWPKIINKKSSVRWDQYVETGKGVWKRKK